MTRNQFIKTTSLLSAGFLLQVNKVIGNTLINNINITNNPNVLYIYPNNVNFTTLAQGCNLRIQSKPAIIALCKNTQGVVEAVQMANQKNLKISVKSGGHCMEGLSCVTGTLTINLSNLTAITWPTANTITVQPACTLQQLYANIIPKGKILPGGSCGKVGIGGLSLGGGYGLLSRQFGLACDSITAATMVAANGTIINTTNNPELLWALKGGGNGNFGIVTNLTFNVHNAPTTMQSYRFREKKLTLTKAQDILKTWFTVTQNLPPQCFSAFVLNHTTAYILLTHTGASNKQINAAIALLKKATSIFSTAGAKPLQAALKNYYGEQQPVYFKNASAGLYNNYNNVAVFFDAVFNKVSTNPGIIYQINTLGGKVKNEAFKNASSFPHRNYNYFSELQSYWQKPTQEAKLVQCFDDIQLLIDATGTIAHYRNYPDLNFKNPLQQYYANSLPRLQSIKKLYDPNNVFSNRQTIVE